VIRLLVCYFLLLLSQYNSSSFCLSDSITLFQQAPYLIIHTGPYDELILVPGNFTVPPPSASTPFQIPKKALRIARIYVSQRTTTYNGRLNWNIPKHLARFSFSEPTTSSTSSPPQSLKVRVYPPGTSENDGVPPFFACTLTPWRWIPRIPLNTAYVPMSLMLAQPPCPEAFGRQAAVEAEAQSSVPIDAYDISHKTEDAVLVGTERWCAIEVKASMGARGCWVEMGKENGDEAGKYWPKGVEPWVSVGAWMEDGMFEFGEPLEWKL
jgi:hypothetical protein